MNILEDFELARAARRVIVTTEEVVDEEMIRNQPCRTVIPFYVVDAVCEVPHGAHPTLMPYLYFFDEEHIGEWLELSQTPEGAAAYFDKYVFGVFGMATSTRSSSATGNGRRCACPAAAARTTSAHCAIAPSSSCARTSANLSSA